MPVRLPTPGSDIKIWGLPLNDSFNPLIGNDRLNIIYNSTSQPPKIGANTKFYFLKTVGSYLTPNVTTGNNVYPGNTTCSYLNADVIFEPADVTFTFGSGGVPAKSNSTMYYIYCSGAEDIDTTSRGKGVYVINTTAPAYDNLRMGWYDSVSGYRAIAHFFVDSGGVVNDAFSLPSNLVSWGYLTAAGTALTATYSPGTIGNHKVFIQARVIPNTTTSGTVKIGYASASDTYTWTRLSTETSTTISTATANSATIANTPSGSSESLFITGNYINTLYELNNGVSVVGNFNSVITKKTDLVRYVASQFFDTPGTESIQSINITTSQNMAIRSSIRVYREV